MKKFIIPFLVIILGLGLLTSCDCGCGRWEDAPPETALLRSAEKWKVQAGADDHGKMKYRYLLVWKWTYEGHDYLEFKQADYYSGWQHDPNCRACESGHKSTSSSGLTDYQLSFGTF